MFNKEHVQIEVDIFVGDCPLIIHLFHLPL